MHLEYGLIDGECSGHLKVGIIFFVSARAAPESRNAYCLTLSPAKETTVGMPCVTTQKRLHARERMTLPIQIPPNPPRPPPTHTHRYNHCLLLTAICSACEGLLIVTQTREENDSLLV